MRTFDLEVAIQTATGAPWHLFAFAGLVRDGAGTVVLVRRSWLRYAGGHGRGRRGRSVRRWAHPPRGLGRKPGRGEGGPSRAGEGWVGAMTFLNVVEIESALIALAATYPAAAHLITLPFLTAEGRRATPSGSGPVPASGPASCSSAGRTRASGAAPTSSSTWPRTCSRRWSAERAGLWRHGLHRGQRPARSLTRVELIVFPDINPDGRHYSQTVYSMWRKNRNPASSGGVREPDRRRRQPQLRLPLGLPGRLLAGGCSAGTLASNRSSERPLPRHGAVLGGGDEERPLAVRPATRSIRRFIDIHSYGGNILHPWGDDANQSTTPSMNFKNASLEWEARRRRAMPTPSTSRPSDFTAAHRRPVTR